MSAVRRAAPEVIDTHFRFEGPVAGQLEVAFLEDLRDHLGDSVEVEVLLGSPPTPASPTDTEIYRQVSSVLSEIAPVVPAFISGFTDSRYFRLRDIPAYGVWPFALELAELQGIHGFNERISLDRFDAGVELMVKVVRACVERSRSTRQ